MSFDDTNVEIRHRLQSLFYLPMLVADEHKMFSANNMNISVINDPNMPSPDQWSKQALIATGPVITLKYLIKHRATQGVKILGTIVRRSPWVVARKMGEQGSVAWADILSQKVGVCAPAPTPVLWIDWLASLSSNRLEWKENARIVNNSGIDQIAELTEGKLDFLIHPFENVAPYVADGSVQIVRTLADDIGCIPWTVIVGNEVFVSENPDVISAALEILNKSLSFIRGAKMGELVEIASKYFPNMTESSLRASIRFYLEQGCWPGSIDVDHYEHMRYVRILQQVGWLEEGLDYQSQWL